MRQKATKVQSKHQKKKRRSKLKPEEIEYSFSFSKPISKKSGHGIKIDVNDKESLTLPGFNNVKVWEWSDGIPIESNIFNIVMTAEIGISLQLEKLAVKLRGNGAQYNKKEFAAIVIRSKTISILLFSQGKIVCTGAKYVSEALEMLDLLLKDLNEICQQNIKLDDVRIQNIVVCVKLPWVIDLKSFSQQYSQYCTYAADVFPGNIIKHPSFNKTTSLVFVSGYMVIAGLKTIDELEKLMNTIPPLIKEFKITSNRPNTIVIDDGVTVRSVPTHAHMVKNKEKRNVPIKYEIEERDKDEIKQLLKDPMNWVSEKGDVEFKIPSVPTKTQETKKKKEQVEIVDMPTFDFF